MKKTYTGFTLVELLAVISIITILAIGVSKINFKTVSNKQLSNIFSSKIISTLETVRNNSLVGKGIGINLETPYSWEIDIPYGSGKVSIYTLSSSGAVRQNYDSLSYTLKEQESIEEINCITFTGSSLSITNTGTISFQNDDISFSSLCGDDSYKILELRASFQGIENTINFNSINGLIGIEK